MLLWRGPCSQPLPLKGLSLLCVQVFGMEFCKPSRQVLRPEGDGQSPLGARKCLDNPTAASLGVPVAPANRPPGSKVSADQSTSIPPLPPANGSRGKSPELLTLEELSFNPFIHSPSTGLPLCLTLHWGHGSNHSSLSPGAPGPVEWRAPIPRQ